MATSVLQPEDCRREHEPKDLVEAPRLTDDDRVRAMEEKERETGDLPPELIETARLELREEPAIREHALKQMRHYIEKHPAIKRCRTGELWVDVIRFILLGRIVRLASIMVKYWINMNTDGCVKVSHHSF